jgi:hypothetical protein
MLAMKVKPYPQLLAVFPRQTKDPAGQQIADRLQEEQQTACQAPVGDLRFAAPQDPLSVEGIQQATEVCIYCLDLFMVSSQL